MNQSFSNPLTPSTPVSAPASRFSPAQAKQAIALATRTLRIEAEAIVTLIPRLNGDFPRAVSMILESTGRMI
ncbi:MAG: hypothetical protein LBS89_00985, partial [Zoogloeaceae bacterium]|nr:hypothetical protein [Zoogloeaceae bacterium]